MKYLLPILILLCAGCSENDTIDREKFASSVKNYYELQAKDIVSIDELIIDSVVPITEKKQLADAISENEKRYYYLIEAKNDEFADSTAKDIDQLQKKLATADNTIILFYTVYHSITFTGNDQVKRRRMSYLDITSDYQIRPNAVSDMDKVEGIKGEQLYKRYSY